MKAEQCTYSTVGDEVCDVSVLIVQSKTKFVTYRNINI